MIERYRVRERYVLHWNDSDANIGSFEFELLQSIVPFTDNVF